MSEASAATSATTAVPMTDEQKYRFDLQGFLVIPGVLDEAHTAACREQIERINRDPDSLPATHRNAFGGPLAELLDHPVVVGIFDEVLGRPGMASDETYSFRCESQFTTLRNHTSKVNADPHGGGGLFNFPGNSHMYHCQPGKMHTGLSRVVWEFNEVHADDGGTRFVPGSHKAAFQLPEAVRANLQDDVWVSYDCPPGSALIFTEGVTHSGAPWRPVDRERSAVFLAYNTVDAKFHHGSPTPEQLAEMPLKRRSLFRGVWWGFRKGEGPGLNTIVSSEVAF